MYFQQEVHALLLQLHKVTSFQIPMFLRRGGRSRRLPLVGFVFSEAYTRCGLPFYRKLVISRGDLNYRG